jgi:hypothetical protein
MKLFVCSEEGGKFPFRGKIAYATVKMGKGAFQENGLESSAEFVQGMTLKPVTF